MQTSNFNEPVLKLSVSFKNLARSLAGAKESIKSLPGDGWEIRKFKKIAFRFFRPDVYVFPITVFYQDLYSEKEIGLAFWNFQIYISFEYFISTNGGEDWI